VKLRGGLEMLFKTPKKGRAASQEAREQAITTVEMYREAQAEPDGCLYADYLENGKLIKLVYLDSTDVEPLLKMLEHFALTGYFNDDSICEMSNNLQKLNAYTAQTKNLKREAALEAISNQFNTSIASLKRDLSSARKFLKSKA
jgi:hypothetical protein